MADVVALVVRFFHIMFGIAWIGAIMYGVGVLRRVMPRVEPAARKAAMKQLLPVVTRYIPGSAVMTIVTGAILYLYIGVYLAHMNLDAFLGTRWGLTLLAALIFSLTAFALGMVFGVGTAKRILTHLEEPTCEHGAEVGGLTRRFNQAQVVVLVLGFVIIALMVYAVAGA